MNKNKAITYGAFIIGSAIIWGAVIIGAAILLKGTPYKESINRLLIGGTLAHLILIWGPMGAMMKKRKEGGGEVEKK